ncbi:MAG: diguanylate cyclase [Thiobacillaceae bacterium]
MSTPDAPFGKFEQALALAQETLNLLTKTHIPPIPPHYAVGYAFYDGTVREIHDVIEERLRQAQALDEDLLRALYERYILPDGYERFRSVRTDLERLLKTILRTLRATDDGNREFMRVLDANIQALDTAQDATSLQAIATALLQAAHRAQARNQALASELKHAREELKHAHSELERHRRAALIDPLTGLYNRRGLDDLLADLWSTNSPITMLVVDIDHFKKINDTHGHQVGDVVIRQVAEVLRKSIRGEDYAARYGGEEFVVLLPDTDLAGGQQVAEHIRQKISKLRLVRRHDNTVIDAFTVSIGVASRQPGDSPESLFKRADEALYLSKSGGRNRVTVKL